jgi:hypothetical protein
MLYSGMRLRVDLIRTDVSEKQIASIFRVERINDLGITPVVAIGLLVIAKIIPSSRVLCTLEM